MRFIVSVPDQELNRALPNTTLDEAADELKETIEEDLGINGVSVEPE